MPTSSDCPPRNPGQTRFLEIVEQACSATRAALTDAASSADPLTEPRMIDSVVAELLTENDTVWAEVTVIG
jgi:hypothetical protein